ncbi:MAG: PAS domain S-box protein [Planctomycetes bacterium]|nr:PAS domain S-box protein [Planctomycetota bacterium]
MPQGLAILLVEPDADLSRRLQRVLDAEGHAVFTVPSAEEAGRAVEEEAFDLVLLPGPEAASDGWVLVQDLARRVPDTGLVVSAEGRDAPWLREAVRHGVRGFYERGGASEAGVLEAVRDVAREVGSRRDARAAQAALREGRDAAREAASRAESRLAEKVQDLAAARREVEGAKRIAKTLRESLNRSSALHNELRAQLDASTVVREITKVMTSTLDLDHVLSTIVQGLQDALHLDRVILFSTDRKGGRLVPRVSGGADDALLRGVALPFDPATTLGDAVATGEPVTVREPARLGEEWASLAARLDCPHFVLTPLAFRRLETSGDALRFVGAIWVDNAEGGAEISREAIDALGTFAHQAAMAMDNSRVHAELEAKERKILEQSRELSREKDKVETIIHTMDEGLFTVDTDRNITYFTRAAERLTGFKAQEVLGRSCRVLGLASCERECWLYDPPAGEAGVAPRGGVTDDETVLVTQVIQELPVQRNARVLRDDDGQVTGGVEVFRDITKARELEQIKADFTSMIVHDLRSPVAAIKGLVELLENDEVEIDPSEEKEFYRMIGESSERMLGLVNDVMDVSKIEAGKLDLYPEPYGIGEAVESALEVAGVHAEKKGVEIVTDLESDLPSVHVDAERLVQVFTNLLTNSVKFTPEGGCITISARADGALADGRVCVQVTVADTGVGIPAEELGQLFEKYKQVSSARSTKAKGTGLGLVICKNIVEAHGGRIWVESEAGHGARFHFTVPTTPSAEGA